MKLETVYDLLVLPIIRNFVVECAVFYGAERKEVGALELAVEEAAAHIIENYPGGKMEKFDIILEPSHEKKSLCVILSNKGLPVDQDNLPSYSLEKPEETLEGLNFFLIRKLTDKFFLENKGREGWFLIIEKRIKNFERNDFHQGNEDEKKQKPRGKFKIQLALPEDAYQITKLAYFTYKYTYPKTIFYYPEILKESIQNGSVIAFVAKNENDEIVANTAFLRSAYSREIAEAGALMSHPDYRRTMAGLRLLKSQYDYPLKNNIDITIIESNLVTSHTGSQRITKSMHFSPFAFKLSVYEHANFIDINKVKNANSRETLLYSIWTPHPLERETTMYVPEKHYEMIDHLIQRSGVPVRLECLCKDPGETVAPAMDITKKEEFGLAHIHLNAISGEWRRNLKNFRKRLSIEGIATIQLQIPADEPIPPGMDEELASAGFFFSGIIPETPDKWMLLYTFLNNQEFDFDNIALCDEVACELRDYIKECSAEIDL